MKIVILDAYTANPGDLDWDGLAALGQLQSHDRTPADLVAEHAANAEIVLTNKTVLSGESIGRLAKLRYIGVLATGYNVVDLAAAGTRGVPVTNIPAYSTPAVAQMVFAHVLHLTQHVAAHAENVRNGDWASCPDFCFWNQPLTELSGRTFGIIGLGQIGREVAGIARAFGMNVIAHNHRPPRELPDGVEIGELDEVFTKSDVLSLHCPLTNANHHLVDAARLAEMKPGALLINTARGRLVDTIALAKALHDGEIAGAGLDVMETEPPPTDHPLYTAPNCHITPHIGWATQAARRRLIDIAVENVRAFINGHPQNVVNADQLT
ncbi:MAG: D-2-hydroxyacid dehydrogenase, partial [Verrucomicrobiota bacterium]|nr:D-2-hydroxyacid dehydrogenase [Verrucomicrobiota bacterium]